MVNTHQMQNRGIQIMHMNRIAGDVVAELICLAKRLDPPASRLRAVEEFVSH
jgi:hypothetical protein